MTKAIADYKAGDRVQVLMNNPRLADQNEWRSAEVIDKRTIYPSGGSHHPPYPILIVRVTRTYCRAYPQYRMVDSIPVYTNSTLEFYDKQSEEGVIYPDLIRMSELQIIPVEA